MGMLCNEERISSIYSFLKPITQRCFQTHRAQKEKNSFSSISKTAGYPNEISLIKNQGYQYCLQTVYQMPFLLSFTIVTVITIGYKTARARISSKFNRS